MHLHSSRLTTRLALAAVLAATASFGVVAARPSDPPTGLKGGARGSPNGKANRNEHRGLDGAGDVIRGGGFARERGQLPVVSDETIIEVIKRLAPQMAEEVERQLKDPEKRSEVRQKLLQNGRRFIGLAILRERHPKLYEAKIKVLEAQDETRQAARQYHDAKDRENIEDMSRAEGRLRDVAARTAQLEILADGLELQALDDYLQQQREELKRYATASEIQRRVDAMVGELLMNPPSEHGNDLQRSDVAQPSRGPSPRSNPAPGAFRSFDERRSEAPTLGDPPPVSSDDAFAPEFSHDRGPFPKVRDQSILEVIKRLAPQMAVELERDLNDPATHEEARRRILQNGRRFVGLAILRERNPKLYEAKVTVIEVQEESRQAAQRFHDAKDRGNREQMARVEVQIREAVERAAQLDVLAQGLELQALDEFLCQQREELKRRAGDEEIRKRIDAIVDDLKANDPRREPEPRRGRNGDRPEPRERHEPPMPSVEPVAR